MLNKKVLDLLAANLIQTSKVHRPPSIQLYIYFLLKSTLLFYNSF